jgi:hypothetical protein
MHTSPTITRNKNPGGAVTRPGAEMLGSWISSNVLQHIDGGKQVVV